MTTESATQSPRDLRRTFTRAISLMAAIFAAPIVHASSSDTDFFPLVREKKWEALEQLAQSRLSTNANEDVALWYLGRMLAGHAERREQLTVQAERCVKALPRSSRCQSVLGTLYGATASAAGFTTGLSYAGRVRDAFKMAVDLEPGKFELRRDLNQFYLNAPGLVGGGSGKAFDNAESYSKLDPLRAQLLRVEAYASEKDFDKSQRTLEAVWSDDADAQLDIQNTRAHLGLALLAANQASRAQQQFEKVLAANPAHAAASVGLGRALAAQKNPDGAIRQFERAVQLDSRSSGNYWLGQAYQSKGEDAKAAVALKTYLAQTTDGRLADEARKLLGNLRRP
jgi:tetratricopeptide (TPR) repeat protein